MIEVFSMNSYNMHFKISLQSRPVAAVWAGIWFLPCVGKYVSSQVLGGLKALATVGATVSLAVGTQDDSQSTVTQTFHFTDTHALKNMARSYSQVTTEYSSTKEYRHPWYFKKAVFSNSSTWRQFTSGTDESAILLYVCNGYLVGSQNIFIMNTQHVRLQVALLISSVITVRAEIRLLPSVGQNMSPQVLRGLKALSTVGTQVSLAVGTHNRSQSTKTQTSHSTDFTYPHALQKYGNVLLGATMKNQTLSDCHVSYITKHDT